MSTNKLSIEEYWLGFVVVDHNGIALSQAFKTLDEARSFIVEYTESENEET